MICIAVLDTIMCAEFYLETYEYASKKALVLKEVLYTVSIQHAMDIQSTFTEPYKTIQRDTKI